MNVYIVKSGRLIDFSGWEWLNLRAFTNYDEALKFANITEWQIDDFSKESVEIEELTLEGEYVVQS